MRTTICLLVCVGLGLSAIGCSRPSAASAGKNETTPSSAASVEQPKSAESSDRMTGKWSGDTAVYGYKFTTGFDFKPYGRVFWKQKGDFGLDNDGGGSYTVKRIEGERYTLRMVNDLSPDESFGWVIIFKDADTFTITGFDDMPITVKRVK